ncbi:PREDICTED: uncharacterized protein LOC109177267 [Ipomoea nil]|uniref:uncharacterized protein LOC109177267 n=1 Tax=Ipomoea nil TaxID=35883 RepID=UPI0009015261|nr:PREDICTED: uncharacterized protein LOC109177267 [Ipomoea nil]
METKVRREHAEQLKMKLNYDGLFYVDGGGVRGGLALLWRDRGVANLISYSKNHIDIQVNLPGSEPWRLTYYYGFPERNRRQQSWNLLRSLKQKSDLPWLVAGDFNDLASPDEKRGLHPHPPALIEGFNQMLDDCGLFDLGMRGRKFTWEKGRGTENWLEERLDRAVAGADWCSMFPNVSVRNHDTITSDHTAIHIEIFGPRMVKQRRDFLFENAWLKEAGCKQVVLESWNFSRGDTVPCRLSHCGISLRTWGGNFAKRTEKEISHIQARLNMLRSRIDGASLLEVRELDGRLRDLNDQLNIYWRQRAKQHWLIGGDRNTKYFHLYASARRRKNLILKLQDESQSWVDGDQLLPLATRYFQNIFTSKGVDFGSNLDGFNATISLEDNQRLLRPFQSDDVREALFSMAPDKSPGPDGFSPAFFQHFWNEIGEDVSRFVLDCISADEFLIGFNDAIITLIPKKSTPTSMVDLRPIALCNVLYKILSKMLANRLKEVLDKVISISQSAFLPGRLITDNVLIASEVIHYLNRKRQGNHGWCALKLDMAKAYDKMEWTFLREMMSRMGFDQRWINLILRCVNTSRYKVNVNGDLSDFIIPTCGLRQGDPLSPYLFILCAEALSHLISRAVTRGMVSPCIVARGVPGLSHLFFADDSLLFLKATVQEAAAIKGCLISYERMSGQSVNFNKSCIVFSRNTAANLRIAVAGTLNVIQSDNIGKYLGLPMGVGRNKKEVFSYIEAKLIHRLSGWNKKILSKASKEILLKSVAQALPTYSMSIYFLPVTLCERIERIMNKFWWTNTGNSGGGIRWMAWQRMCSPKSLGGIGFKNLSRFNIALLAKQGWRLLTQPHSLAARLYKARYYPHSGFLEASIGANPSYCWRSILAGQQLLKQGSYKRIGNGRDTNVWNQPWLPNQEDPFIRSPILNNDVNMKVCSLIDSATQDWNTQLVINMFEQRDAELILKIPVATEFDDTWCWRGDIRGLYSVKNGYRMLTPLHGQEGTDSAVWRNLWRLKIPPNIKNFVWRILHGVLPTMMAINSRGVEVDVSCVLCRLQPETIRHLCCECTVLVPLWYDLVNTPLPNMDDEFSAWLCKCLIHDDKLKVLKSIAFWWCVWHERNEVVWRQKVWQPALIRLAHQRTMNDWNLMKEMVTGSNTHSSNIVAVHGPTENTVRVYVDAAVFPVTHEACFGVFLQSADGEYIAAKNGPIQCMDDIHLAEAVAVKEALSWVKEKGFMHAKVYSDCENICNLVKVSLPDCTYAGCVLEECRLLQRHFTNVSIQFISRSVNKVAHALARAARSQSGLIVWTSSIPSCIEHLI